MKNTRNVMRRQSESVAMVNEFNKPSGIGGHNI